VIVVDDGSADSTIEIVKKYNCRAVTLKKNRGVANARNLGVKYAKNDFIVFIDSDVYIHKNSLSKMVKTYKLNPKIKIICGTQSEKKLSNNFGAKFLALKSYYDYRWKNKDRKKRTSCLNSAFCLIEKKVFDQIKGFDTTYKRAGIEEYEIGYRFWEKKYPISIYKDILYYHDEINLHKRALNLLKRAKLYMPLLMKKRKLELNATGTALDSFIAILSFMAIVSILLPVIATKLIIVPIFFGIVIFLVNIRLLIYFIKKEGFLFSFLSIFAIVYLSLAITMGAILGFVGFVLYKMPHLTKCLKCSMKYN